MTTLLFTVIIYMFPTFLAESRKHRNAMAIGMCNFFLGWTVIFWIVCMIWASTCNTER